MTETVVCHDCGAVIPIPRPPRRHNRWGDGYHGSKNIKRLGPMHHLVLRVLEENKAFDYASGMTSRRVWFACEKILKEEGRGSYCTLNGVRARLSELQGKGPFHLVGSQTNTMNLEDEEEQKFRLEKGNRWYLLQREGMGLLDKLDFEGRGVLSA